MIQNVNSAATILCRRTRSETCAICAILQWMSHWLGHIAHTWDAISIPTCNKPRLRVTRAKQATIFAAPTRSICLLFLGSAGENLRDRFICETYQKHVRERSWHFGGMTGPGKIASDARWRFFLVGARLCVYNCVDEAKWKKGNMGVLLCWICDENIAAAFGAEGQSFVFRICARRDGDRTEAARVATRQWLQVICRMILCHAPMSFFRRSWEKTVGSKRDHHFRLVPVCCLRQALQMFQNKLYYQFPAFCFHSRNAMLARKLFQEIWQFSQGRTNTRV